MAAEMKVTDAAVEAAAKAYFEDMCSLDRWNEPMPDAEREDWREGARKVLQAGLAAMLEPVAVITDIDRDRLNDYPRNDGVVYTLDVAGDGYTTLYRIKP